MSNEREQAKALIDEVADLTENVVRLAQLVSPAVRIESELLRAVRLAAAPQLSAATEGDLWFSPLVSGRGRTGISLDIDVASELRDRLREQWQDPRKRNGLFLARDAMLRVHEKISPALLLEERIAWAYITADTALIDRELSRAINALADRADDDLSMWVAQAADRLPAGVARRPGGWILRQYAAQERGPLQLTESPDAPLLNSAELAAVFANLKDVRFGVRRQGDFLELGNLDGDNISVIEVPDSDPRLLTIETAKRRLDIDVPVGESRRNRVPPGETVRVITRKGMVYEITGSIAPDAVGRDELLIVHIHGDEKWAHRFGEHLKPIVREDKIRFFDDVGKSGDVYDEAINRAKVLLLLVSPAFLDSDWLEKLDPILRQHPESLTITWIAVAPGSFRSTLLSEFQAAHDPNSPLAKMGSVERDLVMVEVCEQVVRSLPEASRREFPESESPPDASVATSEEKRTVFFSYSHEDEAWLERLKEMMAPIVHDNSIEIWDDTKIKAGEDWSASIEESIERARLAIILVSRHYLASEYNLGQELPALLRAGKERDFLILWILVSPCVWENTPLAKFQAAHDLYKPLNSLSQPDLERVLAEIAQKISRILRGSGNEASPEESSGAGKIPNPFYLDASDDPEKPRWVVRQSLMERLHKAVGHERVVLLLGSRRMGKTSTLHALSDLLESNTLMAYIACRSMDSFSPESVLHTLSMNIAAAFEGQGIELSAVHGKSLEVDPDAVFRGWLDELQAALSRWGGRLLVCLDEYELLAQSKDELVLDLLRDMADDGMATILFAGERSFLELGEAWSKRFRKAEVLELPFFTPEESLRVLTEPLPQLEIDHQFLSELVELTGGHPFILQSVGATMVEVLNESRTRQLDIEGVESVINRSLNLLEPFFSDIRQSISEQVWATIIQIAHGNRQESMAPQINDQLRRRQIIDQSGAFTVPLMERWVRQRGSAGNR